MFQGPLLDIVIVSSTGAREHLESCLASLRRYPLERGEMRVQVIDNASEDGTAAMVRERFPEVDLTELDWNAGFCHSNNLGIRQGEAPYVLLLNPDTQLTEPCFDPMIEVMSSDPRIGMAGCRQVRRDGSFDHAAKRSFPTPAGALAHFSGLGRLSAAPAALTQYRAPDIGERESGEVEAIGGSFMLVRRAALDEVGLLDERYWLYMEDLDWCYRFKQRGWKIWYQGEVTMIHVKGGTTVRKRHRGLRHNYVFHRGMGRFYRKFYSGHTPLLDLSVYIGIGVKFMIAVTRSAVAHRRLTLVGGVQPAPASGPGESGSADTVSPHQADEGGDVVATEDQRDREVTEAGHDQRDQ
jgi:N-acetylglucosaminyl-diphospho-decaprenol L-rhamnosyltransferase